MLCDAWETADTKAARPLYHGICRDENTHDCMLLDIVFAHDIILQTIYHTQREGTDLVRIKAYSEQNDVNHMHHLYQKRSLIMDLSFKG